MKHVPNKEPEDSCPLTHASSEAPVEAPAGRDMVNVVLLFAAAMLYVSAVGGAVEILGSFVLREPLSWSATQVTICYYFMCVFRSCICDFNA